METLYIKVGKKYKKFGTTFDRDFHCDGLWLFQSHPSSKEGNNLSLRLCDLPPKTDVQKYLKAFLNKEVISNAILNLRKRYGRIDYCSVSEYTEEIINEIYKQSEKNNNEN